MKEVRGKVAKQTCFFLEWTKTVCVRGHLADPTQHGGIAPPSNIRMVKDGVHWSQCTGNDNNSDIKNHDYNK